MYLNLGHRGTLQILSKRKNRQMKGKTLKVAPRRYDTLSGLVDIVNWNQDVNPGERLRAEAKLN